MAYPLGRTLYICKCCYPLRGNRIVTTIEGHIPPRATVTDNKPGRRNETKAGGHNPKIKVMAE